MSQKREVCTVFNPGTIYSEYLALMLEIGSKTRRTDAPWMRYAPVIHILCAVPILCFGCHWIRDRFC